VIAVFVACAWIGYMHRIQMGVWIWQLRHHGTLKIGAYVVPVSKNWYVDERKSEESFLVWVSPRHTSPPHIPVPTTITLSIVNQNPIDLDEWISFETSGVQADSRRVLRRDFSFDNERLTCVGGSWAQVLGLSRTATRMGLQNVGTARDHHHRRRKRHGPCLECSLSNQAIPGYAIGSMKLEPVAN